MKLKQRPQLSRKEKDYKHILLQEQQATAHRELSKFNPNGPWWFEKNQICTSLSRITPNLGKARSHGPIREGAEYWSGEQRKRVSSVRLNPVMFTSMPVEVNPSFSIHGEFLFAQHSQILKRYKNSYMKFHADLHVMHEVAETNQTWFRCT